MLFFFLHGQPGLHTYQIAYIQVIIYTLKKKKRNKKYKKYNTANNLYDDETRRKCCITILPLLYMKKNLDKIKPNTQNSLLSAKLNKKKTYHTGCVQVWRRVRIVFERDMNVVSRSIQWYSYLDTPRGVVGWFLILKNNLIQQHNTDPTNIIT